MQNIITVLRFGASYLGRYWGRLALGVFFGVVFALTNGSFIWATRTVAERFSPPSPQSVSGVPTSDVPASTIKPGVFKEKLGALSNALRREVDPWLPRMGRKLDWRQVLGALAFLPLLVAIRSGADYLNAYFTGWVSERVIRDMQTDIMIKLSRLSLDFFNRSTTGDLLTRINVDTMNLQQSMRSGFADLVKESATLVAVAGGLLLLDWKLTLSAIVLIPLCLFPLIVLGKKARLAIRSSMKAKVLQSTQLVELISGIRIIKAFNLEENELERFRKTSSKLVRAGMKGVRAREMVNPLIEFISVFGLGALLLYFFAAGRSGSELVAFLAGVMLFFLPIKKLARVHVLFEQASVGAIRLLEILNEQPKVTEPANPKPFAAFKSNIVFENVHFSYDKRVVLRDLNLTVPRGLRVGIAGESGSGKTTLVNLLFRFYDPTHGSIKIDGINLREILTRDLRQQMALVSQDVVVFDQTVAENIAAGKLGASREEIEAAAKAAFAHEFIVQMPEGYDTRVGERGVTLSGGQRQRIAIARAFVRNAPILVLDEATASLDSKSEAEVQAAIDLLAEHRTVICVAHRLSTLAGMDQIIVLSEGRIVETGAFDELLQKGGIFAGMAARQGLTANTTRPTVPVTV